MKGKFLNRYGDRMLKPRIAFCCSIIIYVCLVPSAHAIPAFARQYGTSCSTCHVDFPKLNDFGKAFEDAGFKFPKNDEDFIKVPPVMLGAAAQKEVWPHSIFPGTIPGLPPIGLRFNTFFQVYGRNRNNFNRGTTGPLIPRTDFQPGLFSIFMAGYFCSGLPFWGGDGIKAGGSRAGGGGRAWLPESSQHRPAFQTPKRPPEPSGRPAPDWLSILHSA